MEPKVNPQLIGNGRDAGVGEKHGERAGREHRPNCAILKKYIDTQYIFFQDGAVVRCSLSHSRVASVPNSSWVAMGGAALRIFVRTIHRVEAHGSNIRTESVEMVYFIKFFELTNYFGSGSRNFKEGDVVYNAHHLLYKAITKETKSSVNLFFLCLKSSDLFGKRHEIEIQLFMKKYEKNIMCNNFILNRVLYKRLFIFSGDV